MEAWNYPKLKAPVLTSQEDTNSVSTITISNPNNFIVEVWNDTSQIGIINYSNKFLIAGSTSLHFKATGYTNSSSISVTFVPTFTVDNIIAASKADIVHEDWVGTIVPIKIDGNDVFFRIVDVNTYNLSDGSGKSHYTLEMVDILEKRRMNATNTNEGGWGETEAEAYLNSDEALNRIEEKVRNAIQQVKIPYGAIYNQDSLQYVDNKIFYPSFIEVWNQSGVNETATDEGHFWKFYEKNQNDDSIWMKYLISDPYISWFLRSCKNKSTTRFHSVSYMGWRSNSAADFAAGSSWVFCI